MENNKYKGRGRKKEIVDGRKHCYRCDLWKPVSDFYSDKSGRSATGLSSRCRPCCKNEINERHNNSLDRALRDLWIRHKTNGRVGSKRRQEFTKDTCVNPESLKVMWSSQGGLCAVTREPMTHIQGKGYSVMSNVALDRIDNSKGYEKDNVRLVCRAVNYMKASMSDTELLKWASLILSGPLTHQGR